MMGPTYGEDVLVKNPFVVETVGGDYEPVPVFFIVHPTPDVFFTIGDVIHDPVTVLHPVHPIPDVERGCVCHEIPFLEEPMPMGLSVFKVTSVDVRVRVFKHP